ncbi:hypothetical protein HIM_02415 [Hirsutella minnesotensis 3608]|nr:hypothetical protein HIM_02415 [Hirsutella minnesotensis 3608]
METKDGAAERDGSSCPPSAKASMASTQLLASKGEAASSQPTSAYKPQFAATGSSILNRLQRSKDALNGMKSKNPSPMPAGKESQQRISTMAMPKPVSQQTPLAWPDIQRRFLQYNAPNLKRKRESSLEETDFAQNTIPFRAPAARLESTPSSPQPITTVFSHAPKCQKCSSNAYSPENDLVFCFACKAASHLQCLPSITELVDTKNHLCRECKVNAPAVNQVGPGSPEENERRRLVNKVRGKRLSNLPAGVVPAKPELVGFFAGQASDAERSKYFYTKKKTDLLNILSLADQLKPQLLVDILVSVSIKHPDLPIFDDPSWKANVSNRASSIKTKTAIQNARNVNQSKSGAVSAHAKERRAKGRPKLIKQVHVADLDARGTEDGVGQGVVPVEHSLPPTWPRAGEGLYSKLPPEDEDKAFLADENDEEAFSHFMVDKSGKQVVVPVCA